MDIANFQRLMMILALFGIAFAVLYCKARSVQERIKASFLFLVWLIIAIASTIWFLAVGPTYGNDFLEQLSALESKQERMEFVEKHSKRRIALMGRAGPVSMTMTGDLLFPFVPDGHNDSIYEVLVVLDTEPFLDINVFVEPAESVPAGTARLRFNDGKEETIKKGDHLRVTGLICRYREHLRDQFVIAESTFKRVQ